MKGRLPVLPLFLLYCVWTSASGSAAGSAPRTPHHIPACGAPVSARDLQEPPDIEVWKLPVDAGGERELILSVHRDGPRFCYRYVWNGGVQTIAPAIRVHRGEHFALRIVNDITTQSKGERVASTTLPKCIPAAMPMTEGSLNQYVGYLNHPLDDRYMKTKPIDTNIHLHGFEGPADQENIFLSTLSTPMHACEYHITIPRSQPPGTYFYHPHVHGASFQQVAFGLSGAWIVEPDTEQIPRSAEHLILLRYRMPPRFDNPYAPDETAIGNAAAAHEGALRFERPVAYAPFDPPPWPVTYPTKAGDVSLDASGCDGMASESFISVNGSDTPASLDVPVGATQLMRIVNATSDSPKLLKLSDSHGRAVQLRVVARDGIPVSGDAEHPLAQYIPMASLLISPSARADILLTATPGQTLTLSSGHFCEGKDAFYQMHHDLLRIRAVASAGAHAFAVSSSPVHTTDTSAARLVAFARAHSSRIRRRAITFTEYQLPKLGKIPQRDAYFITDTTNPNFREHPFWPEYRTGGTVPSNADIVVKAGSIEEWYLIN
ncbi:MAG: multicopper oxidase domain-containing protein, partial [Candidatus Baltobacteraceae bacterium]